MIHYLLELLFSEQIVQISFSILVMDSRNQHQPFFSLPVELLEEIYVLSETLALSHVCRRFYISLSSQSARLRFCTRLFYADNPRRDPDETNVYLRGKQTKILAQEWFTLDFVTSLKAAVKHIRASDKPRKKVRSELSPNIYLDTETNAQIYYPFFVSGVHLPARLLSAPWSQSKSDLLGQLYIWGLETKPLDKLRCFESMKGAIAEGNWEALEILLLFGPTPDLEFFKDLVLSGRGSTRILRKLFDWVRGYSSLFWGDSEILEWVKNRGKEELEKRGITEKAEASP